MSSIHNVSHSYKGQNRCTPLTCVCQRTVMQVRMGFRCLGWPVRLNMSIQCYWAVINSINHPISPRVSTFSYISADGWFWALMKRCSDVWSDFPEWYKAQDILAQGKKTPIWLNSDSVLDLRLQELIEQKSIIKMLIKKIFFLSMFST